MLLTYISLAYDVPHFNQINLVSATPPFTPTSYFYPAHTYTSGFVFVGAGTEYALGGYYSIKRTVLADRIPVRRGRPPGKI